MNGTVTVVLSIALAAPLIGGLVAPWLGRRAVIAGLLAGCGLGLAGAVLQGTSDVAWPTWGPVTWLSIPELRPLPTRDGLPVVAPFTIRLGLRFDPLAVAGLVSLTLAGALILVADTARSVRPAIMIAFAAVAASSGLLAVDLVQWLVCGAVLTLLVIGSGGPTTDSVNAVGTRRILVVHLVADALLLSAVLLLWNVGEAVRMDKAFMPGGSTLSRADESTWAFAVENLGLAEGATLTRYLQNGSRLPEAMGAERAAVFSLLGFALLGGLGARCGAFPLFGWLHDAGRRSPTSALLAIGIAVPCSALLLARSQNVLVAAPDVRLILAMGGAATAVVNGVITLAQDDGRVVLGYTVGALVGVALVGLAAGGPGAAGATLLLLSLPPVVASFNWGLEQRTIAAGRRVLGAAGFVLAIGILGQGGVVSATTSGEAPGGALVMAMLFAAMACVSFGLTRTVLGIVRQPTPDDRTIVVESTPSPVPSPLVELLCYASILFAVGLALGIVPPAGAVRSDLLGANVQALPLFDATGIGAAALAAAVGAAAAWALSGREGADPGRVGEPLGPLVRLSRNRFYTDVFSQLFLSLPVRAFAQVCRFVDWFVLDGAVTGLPRSAVAALDASGRPLRRAPVSVAILAILGSAAALVWTLSW